MDCMLYTTDLDVLVGIFEQNYGGFLTLFSSKSMSNTRPVTYFTIINSRVEPRPERQWSCFRRLYYVSTTNISEENINMDSAVGGCGRMGLNDAYSCAETDVLFAGKYPLADSELRDLAWKVFGEHCERVRHCERESVRDNTTYINRQSLPLLPFP